MPCAVSRVPCGAGKTPRYVIEREDASVGFMGDSVKINDDG